MSLGVMTAAERWQTFARVMGWGGVARIVAKTALGSAAFQVTRIASRSPYMAYENCKNAEDYFDFAAGRFPSNQIKEEILSFLAFAAPDKPRNVCEIGTYHGGTNFLLSQVIPSVSLTIGIDLYVRNAGQLCYFSRPDQQINFINGLSSAASTQDKVSRVLAGQKLDLLFIDGDHEYDGVRLDFLSYRHLVRENGIIAFHDIVSDHASRFGKKTGRWAGDVPRFWSKIRSLYPCHEFVADPDQDGCGIGAIRYSASTAIPADL